MIARTARQFPFVIALVVVLALAPIALAGKGSGGKPGGSGGTTGSSSITLVLLNSTDGTAHFGQPVTFKLSLSDMTETFVYNTCKQNGAVVYEESHGMWAGAMFGSTFYLGPTQSWSGGAADCTARIVRWTSNGRQSTLGSTSYHVYA